MEMRGKYFNTIPNNVVEKDGKTYFDPNKDYGALQDKEISVGDVLAEGGGGEWNKTPTGLSWKKYCQEEETWTTYNSFIIFRYAEAYLLRAEALVETGGSTDEAKSLIKVIRDRAGNTNDIDKMVAERGYNVIEDAGRGYRRVVASPRPQSIIEIQSIRDMVEAGLVVVACGGGGIPVYKTEGHHLKGAAAVIDKDFASCVLAQQVEADTLIILTAVEKVAINFGKPDEKWLDSLTPDEASKYIGEGHFAPGSMLPKVEAAVEFAESAPGRSALITLLEKAKDGVAGKTGTAIHQ